MKLTGKVAFRDLEGGVWVLEGDDGRTYELVGGDRKMLRDGVRVQVEGELRRDAVTVAMIGPVVSVKHYKML
jgi:hypothetical protein